MKIQLWRNYSQARVSCSICFLKWIVLCHYPLFYYNSSNIHISHQKWEKLYLLVLSTSLLYISSLPGQQIILEITKVSWVFFHFCFLSFKKILMKSNFFFQNKKFSGKAILFCIFWKMLICHNQSDFFFYFCIEFAAVCSFSWSIWGECIDMLLEK